MSDQPSNQESLVLIGATMAPYDAAEKSAAALRRLLSSAGKPATSAHADRLKAQVMVADAIVTLTGGESQSFGRLADGDEMLYCYRDQRPNPTYGMTQTPDGRIVSTWSNSIAAVAAVLTGQAVKTTPRMLEWLVRAASYHSAGGTGKYQP